MTPEDETYIRNEAKKALRGRMRVLRKRLPAEARALRSASLLERFTEMPEARPRTKWFVAGFVPVHAEVDVAPVLELCRQRGATILLPRVQLDRDRGRADIVWHVHEPGDVLERGAFPVPEPLPTAPIIDPADIDVVIVPGLVMDERGHRVGYGRGFYDRALATMVRAFRCGVCFDFQFVVEVPNLPHDLPLHAVVTDARVVRASSDGAATPPDPTTPAGRLP